MKQTLTILLLTLVGTILIRCGKCPTGHLHLDSTKSWLPLKGKTQLFFTDSVGNSTRFPLKVIDTTVTATNKCGSTYEIDYITATLYLNSSMTDSIYLSLATGSWLCITAYSYNNPNMTICNIFNQTKEGVVAKNLSNYSIGGKTYNEVILILHNPGYSETIDSVFIANKAGIVGFKYHDKHYTLK
jgi:hypothetical protein